VLTVIIHLFQKLCFFGQTMENSKETKITLMVVTATLASMILLFPAATTIAPLQQAYSLSRYVVGVDNPSLATDDANGKIYQPLEQELGNIPKTPTISSVPCAMDNIESLESFLSCLGAK
jgi:hypothetical protein